MEETCGINTTQRQAWTRYKLIFILSLGWERVFQIRQEKVCVRHMMMSNIGINVFLYFVPPILDHIYISNDKETFASNNIVSWIWAEWPHWPILSQIRFSLWDLRGTMSIIYIFIYLWLLSPSLFCVFLYDAEAGVSKYRRFAHDVWRGASNICYMAGDDGCRPQGTHSNACITQTLDQHVSKQHSG